MATLRLILNDQLSLNIASLRHINKSEDIVLLCETHEEATYVKHHKQKLVFAFSCMRHFADELKKNNVKVEYVKIDDPLNTGSLDKELERAIIKFKPNYIELTFPGEYRLLKKFQSWQKSLSIEVKILEDDRFFCDIKTFKNWSDGKQKLHMEFFYRMMRKKHNILMKENNMPINGKWNYDADNRQPIKAGILIPERLVFTMDPITTEVIKIVEKLFHDHFGDLEKFNWAVTRDEALSLLMYFIKNILPNFGKHQDAMDSSYPFLFHSLLSPYINNGLLSPREVCSKVELAYKNGEAPINSVEGFIRQILGWREYMRGVYWYCMPQYANQNYFKAKRKLPQFYWNADTEMNCLHQVIQQTKEYSYSHHIQRLMITGNFALITALDPKEVCEWYLIVYLDAYEWVELPNTLGMALYGDGGFLGTKPYAASAKYIDRMSNFCSNCKYNPNEVITDNACPFNFLYWNFMHNNQKLLRNNPRLMYTYKIWDKTHETKRNKILNNSKQFLKRLESLSY